MARPTPIADALSAPYWDNVAQGRFTLPRCTACSRFHFYPRPACPHCGAETLTWTAASGRGSVYSFSIVQRAPSAAFAGDVPYVVAIVATDEGPHLMSRVVGVRPDEVRIGMRVRVRVEAQGDAPMLPLFEFDPNDAVVTTAGAAARSTPT